MDIYIGRQGKEHIVDWFRDLKHSMYSTIDIVLAPPPSAMEDSPQGETFRSTDDHVEIRITMKRDGFFEVYRFQLNGFKDYLIGAATPYRESKGERRDDALASVFWCLGLESAKACCRLKRAIMLPYVQRASHEGQVSPAPLTRHASYDAYLGSGD